jgi:hypothetical protein
MKFNLRAKFKNFKEGLRDSWDAVDLSKTTWIQSHTYQRTVGPKAEGKKEYEMGIADLQADGTWSARVLHGDNLRIMYTLPADKLGEKLDIHQAIDLMEKFDAAHANDRRKREFNAPYAQKIKRALERKQAPKP